MKIGVSCEEYSYYFYKKNIMIKINKYEDLIYCLNHIIDDLRRITTGNLSHNIFHVRAYAYEYKENSINTGSIIEEDFNDFIKCMNSVYDNLKYTTTGNYSHKISNVICICGLRCSLFKLKIGAEN